VAPVDAVLRPKGMGLGADRSQTNDLNSAKQGGNTGNKKQDSSAELRLTKGAHCLIENGTNKDLYGTVSSQIAQKEFKYNSNVLALVEEGMAAGEHVSSRFDSSATNDSVLRLSVCYSICCSVQISMIAIDSMTETI